MKVICVHGKISVDKRSCKCHKGWGSLNLSSDQLDPDDPVYRLCNIPVIVEKWPSNMALGVSFTLK